MRRCYLTSKIVPLITKYTAYNFTLHKMDAKLLKTLIKKKSDETSNTRLQSLRLPRDLSLGGTKPKKVYVPNVNVIRNKDKAKEVIKNFDRKGKERVKNEPRNRNFGDNQRFVQSTGIFSDGAAEQRRSTAFSERSQYSRDNDPSAGISVPTYNKCKWMVDKQKEDVVLDELVSQENDVDEEKMPLMPVMWKDVDFKGHVIVKQENKLNGDSGNHMNLETERVLHYFQKVEGEEHSRLALLKLPDSLAGKGLSDDPNVKKIFDYPLNVMLEGKIGTLQIRRSGKMYLRIGHVKYLIESTDFFSSKESVAAFTEPAFGQDRPHLALLGNIQQRFVMNPVWNYLLKS